MRRNPAQGIRTLRVRLTWLARGVLSRAIGQSGQQTSPGTVGKSDGREELNRERLARACQ